LSEGGVDPSGVTDPGLSFIASRRQYDDSDLETEPEMPPTDTIIAKDILRKLKPKERKRQDVINGMCHWTWYSKVHSRFSVNILIVFHSEGNSVMCML